MQTHTVSKTVLFQKMKQTTYGNQTGTKWSVFVHCSSVGRSNKQRVMVIGIVGVYRYRGSALVTTSVGSGDSESERAIGWVLPVEGSSQ